MFQFNGQEILAGAVLKSRGAVILAAILGAAACGGGQGSAPTYSIGGTVSGLAGSGLMLENDGSGDLAVRVAGAFTFATPLTVGKAYAVTVKTQPVNPTQSCVVTNGTGTVDAANVTTVAVTCSTTYSVGGVVSGLLGSGLVIENNGTVDQTVTDGSYAFSPVPAGAAYAITVKTQPSNPVQTCVPTNGTGIAATANVTDVNVVCALKPGRFAYLATTAQLFSGTVTSYVIDAVGGQLTRTGSVSTDPNAEVSLSPGGRFAYTIGTSATAPALSIWAIDDATGTLNPLPVGSVTLPHPFPQFSVFTPDRTGAFGYFATDAGIYQYQIDTATGIPVQMAAAPVASGGIAELAIDPLNRFLYAVDGTAPLIYAYSINASTGALTSVPGSPFSGGEGRLTINPVGTFCYVANATGGTIAAYSINTSTGALSAVGLPASAGGPVLALTIAPAGGFAYAVDTFTAFPGPPVMVYSITPTDGALAALGASFQVGVGTNPTSVVFHPSGKFAYVPTPVDGTGAHPDIYEFAADAATGALTPLNGSPVPDADFTPTNFVISDD